MSKRKNQIQSVKLEMIEELLESAIQNANIESKKYSTDLLSQRSFEVGYLGGVIKEALMYIKDENK